MKKIRRVFLIMNAFHWEVLSDNLFIFNPEDSKNSGPCFIVSAISLSFALKLKTKNCFPFSARRHTDERLYFGQIILKNMLTGL